MTGHTEQLASIAETLARDLDRFPIEVLMNDRYIVLISDKYGLATVCGDKDPTAASKGALEIARHSGISGVDALVHYFVVSDAPGEGDTYVRPNAMALDITTALVSRSRGKDVLSRDDALMLVDLLKGKRRRKLDADAARKPIPPVTPEFKRMLLATIVRQLGDHEPFVAGVAITPEYMVSEDFMLGPLLTVAAEHWTPPYLAAKRQGGFCFSVRRASDSVIGYTVTGLAMASPMIVMTAVAAVIRSNCRNGICVLDPCIKRFADFILGVEGKDAVLNMFAGDDMFLNGDV